MSGAPLYLVDIREQMDAMQVIMRSPGPVGICAPQTLPPRRKRCVHPALCPARVVTIQVHALLAPCSITPGRQRREAELEGLALCQEGRLLGGKRCVRMSGGRGRRSRARWGGGGWGTESDAPTSARGLESASICVWGSLCLFFLRAFPSLGGKGRPQSVPPPHTPRDSDCQRAEIQVFLLWPSGLRT